MPRLTRGEDGLHERVVAVLRGEFLGKGFGPKNMPVFHCPNEGKFPPKVMAKRYRMGVSAGVPDLIIAHPTLTGHVGAALELKVGKNKASPTQREWLARFEGMGFAVAVTTGHEETISKLVEWGYIGTSTAMTWLARDGR